MDARFEDRTIRPSTKPVWIALVLGAIVIGVALGFYQGLEVLLSLVVLIPSLKLWINRSLISLRCHDGRLTLESGLFSRTRRTMDLTKIQDVTVHETLAQRVIGIGDLMLESAGESGALAVRNLDNPRELADYLTSLR